MELRLIVANWVWSLTTDVKRSAEAKQIKNKRSNETQDRTGQRRTGTDMVLNSFRQIGKGVSLRGS